MKGNWRHVWGFSGYVISEEGVVVNRSTGNILEQSVELDGCTTVILYTNTNLPMKKKVCRLVVDSFDWVSEGYTPIYHLDGDKRNNHFDNLRRKSLDVDVQSRYAAESAYLTQSDINRLSNEKLEAEKQKEPKEPTKPRAKEGRYPRGFQDRRPVRVIETGEEYESKIDLCRAKGLDPSTVSKMLRRSGRNKTHHGLTFEYIDNQKPYIRIVQTDQVYFSLLEMCQALRLDTSNVRKMLKGTTSQKTYRKMSFEYVERNDPSLENVEILRFSDTADDIPKVTTRGIVRPVRIVQTGQVFANQIEAARAIGGKQNCISRCLKKQRGSHMGYRFEYADEGETNDQA